VSETLTHMISPADECHRCSHFGVCFHCVVVSYVLACLMVVAAICLLCLLYGGCRMERLLFIGPVRINISK
jgi:hypothetical protein